MDEDNKKNGSSKITEESPLFRTETTIELENGLGTIKIISAVDVYATVNGCTSGNICYTT